jgi:putative transcriptional regulator
MAIRVNLDVMLAKRKMKLMELAERIGITPQNLSVLNAGRARAVRFVTLDSICRVLECQPGDILEFVPGDPAGEADEI